MSLLLAVMAQAVASVPPEKIDVTVGQPCEMSKSNENEIVVCAHQSGDLGPYRIKELPFSGSSLPRAQVQLADGLSASVDTQKADVGGFTSKRLMMGIKMKF